MTDKPTQRQIAKALGVVPSQIVYCKRKGMPVDSVESARAWREAHLEYRRPHGEEALAIEPDIDGIEFVVPEGKSPEEILERLKTIEVNLAGQISYWSERVKTEPTNAILQKLTLLRKEHREAAKTVMVYVRAIQDLSKERGKLVSLEASDAYTLGIVAPIIASIKGLPRLAENESERAVLARAGKHLLSEVSASSAMAARAAA